MVYRSPYREVAQDYNWRTDNMASSYSVKFWKILTLVLITVSVSLLIAIIVISSRRSYHPDRENTVLFELETAEWYNELQPTEIESVVKFLVERGNLSIVTAQKARLNDTFIHFVELQMPVKKDVLRYLHVNTILLPKRQARAVVFRGNKATPCVEEYVIGPLPNITYIHKIRTIPFYQRPITVIELQNLKFYIIKKVETKARDFLLKEYDALPIHCMARCLQFSLSPVPSVLGKPHRRLLWLLFAYKSLYDISPVNFQLETDITSPSPSDWTVGKVWFDNKMYNDLDNLIRDYNKSFNKNTTRFYQRTVFQGNPFSLHRYENREESSGETKPKKPYTLLKQSTIHYLKWKFHFHISPSVGLRILNIRYCGGRIVYELSLQEIAVLYSGYSPAGIMLNFVDGTALFGSRSKGLIAGVDCPNHATYLSPFIYSSNDGGMKKMKNALCIFDEYTTVPLSRHKFSTTDGTFFDAMLDKILILRTIVTFMSYDYIIDYLFHQNGAIEVKIHSTGTLLVTAYSPNKRSYGVQIGKTTIANIHNHLFHYKVDMDVKGTQNRFETWNLQQYHTPIHWNGSIKTHIQKRLTRTLIKTENNATFDYGSPTPKYLLFYNKKFNNEFRNPRSYRVIINDVSNLLLAHDYGFARTVSWAYHHMSVTLRKDNEARSSSVYALWDNDDQVVNFVNFTDGESICDKDLVAWITLGFQHIPQMENIPSTNTLGTKVSFLLMPFNYFDHDPLLNEKDRYFFPVDDDQLR